MDISLLSTTSDPEQLRALAIAMVQKAMAESQNLANMVLEKDRNIAELQNRIRILEEQMKLARQQRFGKKCESLAGMQRSLFEEDVDADIAEISAHLDRLLPQTGDEEKTTTRPVRKALPSHLPRVEKVIPATEECCPECNESLHFIRNEVSEKMEYIPAQVVVNRYIRPQYSCPCCEKVFSGKMPAHILPKSAVEPSVIAQVVISKYTDHLPLYRQQYIFSRMGVAVPVSTMADMVGVAGAALAPLAKLLRHELLTRDVIHADETSLRLLDTRKGGKSCSGWLWAYVSGERSGPPVVCFDSQTGRALRYPEAWLQGWRGGTLVSDGYSVYKSLADNHPGITSACCWSHARRGFASLYKASREPRAAMALRKIAGLYRIEKLIRDRPVEKIRQWRQRYSRPIVNDLFAWLEEQEPCCPPDGPLNKAINYILNRRDELSCFLGDGAVPLDNNICERAIRPVVMGREAWLFAGSLMAGNRAAQIISLLETAKRNGLEPHAWLTDVLTRLPEWPEERLAELLHLEGFTFTG